MWEQLQTETRGVKLHERNIPARSHGGLSPVGETLQWSSSRDNALSPPEEEAAAETMCGGQTTAAVLCPLGCWSEAQPMNKRDMGETHSEIYFLFLTVDLVGNKIN